MISSCISSCRRRGPGRAAGAVTLRTTSLLAAVLAVLLLSACGHKKVVQVTVPPPPEKPGAPAPEPESSKANRPLPEPEVDRTVAKKTKPIYVETGIASWYGRPFDHRRGANGEVYDMHGLTAAHRTLPLNTVVRVTNLQTGHSTLVRITDRGPFIEGRMLDLSLAAAKQLDVWRAGTARVKLEVMDAPAPLDHGGRWCVQIGAFHSRQQAAKLKTQLQRRYRTADVLEFTGSTGEWIRVRVKDDDRQRAESLLRETRLSEGTAFLVRLD